MAAYKVWLTVRDSYGNIKEIEGGSIDVKLDTLTPDDLKMLDDHFATDVALNEVIEDSNETIRYAGFEFTDTVGEAK